ncbi:S8 family serine peptidase, partial [Geodermatophilus sp. YIM 151500]|uniref:S8 family serine peptidase n=1 Tax=Geodermatophilus sp. YIM 151500 TaxID=2984531 RepID=UPI0021E43F9F
MKQSTAGHGPASAPGFGVTWGGPPRAAGRVLTVAAAAAVIAGMAGPAAAQTVASAPADPVSVIVQELPGSGNGPERAVAALGGSVVRPLEVIDGFEASVPGNRLAVLRAAAGVKDVTENAAVTLTSAEVDQQAGLNGSLRRITHEMTGASALWDAGYTGAGVDVAVIDSGVVAVDGLRTAGKVVHGPDLSFEAMDCKWGQGCKPSPVNKLDTYGHGTHMAGIIAGRDDTAPATVTSGTAGEFVGVAPDARIVSVKVADAQGRTDVSQAIAAIDWVIQHKNANGMNIRVLNMSFGTDGVQAYQLDPLAYAAEQAWHKGIVVVVAAGNTGYGSAKLNNPAYDPYLIAVGGSDGVGTPDTADDIVGSWSASGDGTRNPDVVAPGQSVVSLRVAGSALDTAYPAARTGERFFRGTGTSQAAAVVSGAAALLLEQRPGLTPDQVKALLTGTARELPNADAIAQGSGLIDVAAASAAPTPQAVQTFERATGTGSLDKARGTNIIEEDGKELRGERDFTGRTWNSGEFASKLREAVRSGTPLSGLSWSGLSWSGLSWSGLSWSGLSWSGLSWSGLSWSG